MSDAAFVTTLKTTADLARSVADGSKPAPGAQEILKLNNTAMSQEVPFAAHLQKCIKYMKNTGRFNQNFIKACQALHDSLPDSLAAVFGQMIDGDWTKASQSADALYNNTNDIYQSLVEVGVWGVVG